ARSPHPPAHQATSPPRRRVRTWVVRATLVVLAAIVLATGVTVAMVLPLRSSVPETTSYSRRADAGPIVAVDAEAVSSWVFVAVIASEDQRFAAHQGIDAAVTRDLAARAVSGERTRGGSTISQQLARNLWLTPSRSWARKGVEAWLALGLDRMLDKSRELELYVNVVDWGHGTFGICRAAWRFFGVPPVRLTQQQAALLATALPDPADRNPAAPDARHRDLATGLVLRMQTTPGYHNTTVLEAVGLPLDPIPTLADQTCDRPPPDA
ncbi:MAG: biosynthetic peptidoglycan transglycosylase, partial [Microthrixaceae bacterium]